MGVFRSLLHKRIPWEKIHLFMVDEMLVSLDHRESNFKLARDSFLDARAVSRILPLSNVDPFVANRSKRNFGIDDCEGELIRHGGVYDIILLSSGEDGGVTSLFPYHHSITDESKSYLILHDSPKPLPDRMSISRKLLVRSKIAILLFIGKQKGDAYSNFKDETTDFRSCPAKLIRFVNDSYVLTDSAILKERR